MINNYKEHASYVENKTIQEADENNWEEVRRTTVRVKTYPLGVENDDDEITSIYTLSEVSNEDKLIVMSDTNYMEDDLLVVKNLTRDGDYYVFDNPLDIIPVELYYYKNVDMYISLEDDVSNVINTPVVNIEVIDKSISMFRTYETILTNEYLKINDILFRATDVTVTNEDGVDTYSVDISILELTEIPLIIYRCNGIKLYPYEDIKYTDKIVSNNPDLINNTGNKLLINKTILTDLISSDTQITENTNNIDPYGDNSLLCKINFEDNCDDISDQTNVYTYGYSNYVDGKYGKGLHSNLYTYLLLYNGDFNTSEQLTISFWFKPEHLNSKIEHSIVSSYNGFYRNSKIFDIILNPDKTITFKYGKYRTNGVTITSDRPILFNVWSHITLVIDTINNDMVGYIDGNEVCRVNDVIIDDVIDGYFRIFHWSPTNNYNICRYKLECVIDKYEVYNRVLNSNEINDLYNNEKILTTLNFNDVNVDVDECIVVDNSVKVNIKRFNLIRDNKAILLIYNKYVKSGRCIQRKVVATDIDTRIITPMKSKLMVLEE